MNEVTENIVDQFGRHHNYLRISLTERCNLRCVYCMPADGIELRPKSHFMTYEEVHDIAKIFVSLGVNKIRLTGGEPLVRKDVDVIINRLAELPVELALTTNGILVDKHLQTFQDAGLQSINVSLDSLDKDKMNQISRRDYFDKIIANIKLLVNSGFSVKVNAVLMKGVNDDEVCDFIDLTQSMKLGVRFIEFMPFDGNKWDWEKGVSQKEILEMVDNKYGSDGYTKLEGKPNDTARNYKIKGYTGDFGIISSVTNPFCDTCNRIRLTADGKIINCLFSNDEIDLLKVYRAGGDIVPLILQSISGKKAVRAGMNTIEDMSRASESGQNRAMISIGG